VKIPIATAIQTTVWNTQSLAALLAANPTVDGIMPKAPWGTGPIVNRLCSRLSLELRLEPVLIPKSIHFVLGQSSMPFATVLYSGDAMGKELRSVLEKQLIRWDYNTAPMYSHFEVAAETLKHFLGLEFRSVWRSEWRTVTVPRLGNPLSVWVVALPGTGLTWLIGPIDVEVEVHYFIVIV
jgi:hypothetical protein